MNENKLNSLNRQFMNKQSDQRSTFVDIIETKLDSLQEPADRNKFLLEMLPYISRYTNELKIKTNVSCTDQEIEHKNSPSMLESMIHNNGVCSKGEVYRSLMKDKFAVVFDDQETDDDLTNCSECKQNSMTYIMSESTMTCTNCGYCYFYQDFGAAQFSNTTNNNSEFTCQFAYKRINHFREWLTQIQGKENTVIPTDLIIKIMKELKKERIENVNEITYEKIKKYLKKSGLSKYYEHIPIIINKICRKDKLYISSETENVLLDYFGKIQIPFDKHRPKGRKNFLSYSYTLHKLCQIIGREDLLTLFPLLKSRTKLYLQDDTWEKICAELGWKFIPSL